MDAELEQAAYDAEEEKAVEADIEGHLRVLGDRGYLVPHDLQVEHGYHSWQAVCDAARKWARLQQQAVDDPLGLTHDDGWQE